MAAKRKGAQSGRRRSDVPTAENEHPPPPQVFIFVLVLFIFGWPPWHFHSVLYGFEFIAGKQEKGDTNFHE